MERKSGWAKSNEQRGSRANDSGVRVCTWAVVALVGGGLGGGGGGEAGGGEGSRGASIQD